MKAMGFGSGADEANLRRIAGMFGERGEYISAVNQVELVGSFEAAAAELREARLALAASRAEAEGSLARQASHRALEQRMELCQKEFHPRALYLKAFHLRPAGQISGQISQRAAGMAQQSIPLSLTIRSHAWGSLRSWDGRMPSQRSLRR